jgi:hypothetical protein
VGKPLVLIQNSSIALVSVNVTLSVHELAAHAVGAVLFLVELKAGPRHEVLGQMRLLNQLVGSMRIRAAAAPLAGTSHVPVLAHFGLLLAGVLFDELRALLWLAFGTL